MEDFIIESITLRQEADTCSDQDEVQVITIDFLSNGMEFFWKIKKAENWAVSPEEVVELVEKLNRIADNNTKLENK